MLGYFFKKFVGDASELTHRYLTVCETHDVCFRTALHGQEASLMGMTGYVLLGFYDMCLDSTHRF